MDWKTRLNWKDRGLPRVRALLDPEALRSDAEAVADAFRSGWENLAWGLDSVREGVWRRRIRQLMAALPKDQIGPHWDLSYTTCTASYKRREGEVCRLHFHTDGVSFRGARYHHVFAPGATILCAMRTVELAYDGGRDVLQEAYKRHDGAQYFDSITYEPVDPPQGEK